MRSLLRKDLRWVAFLAAAGVLIHLWIEAAESAANIWIFPRENYGWISLTYHAIAGTILGLLATVSEDLTQTREYLLHRPVSPARLFWARQIGALIVLSCWVVLVPALHLLGTLLWRRDAVLVDPSRLWTFICDGTPAFLFYALAVFAGSVVRRPFFALLLAASTGLVALLYLLLVLFEVNAPSFTVVAPLLSLGASALLLASAERAARNRPDPDRPWPAGRLVWAAPLLVLVVALASSAVVTGLQVASRENLFNAYPAVVPSQSGPVLAVETDGRQRLKRVDEQHRPVGPLGDNDRQWLFRAGKLAPDDADIMRSERFPHRGWRFRGQFCGDDSWTRGGQAFPCSDGYVHLVRTISRDSDERAARYLRLGRGPENRPFSARSTWFQEDGVIAISDPEDGGLWLLDPRATTPAFSRVELPDGDHFVHRAYFAVPRDRPLGLMHLPLPVRGERGVYVWQKDRFVAAPADAALEPENELHLDYPRRAAVAFTLTVTDAGGRTVLQHRYQPRTAAEKTLAFLTLGVSVLRPTIISLLSLPASDRAFEAGQSLILDQAVAAGERQVLIPIAVLTVLLGALTHRRLRRFGASAARRRFWLAAVFLGGLPVFLCQLLVETRRAWLPMPAEPQPRPAPALLIQSV